MRRIGIALGIAVLVLCAAPAAASTRIDYLHTKIGGGNYGFYVEADLFPMRFTYFYLVPLRISGAYGAAGLDGWEDEEGYIGKGGLVVGLAIPFGAVEEFELRFGVGVTGGITHNGGTWTWWSTYQTWHCASNGPFIDPELLFIWRATDSVGFSAGVELSFPVTQDNWNGHGGDWTPGMSGAAMLGIVI